jgi:hypothetical protein
MRRTLGHLLFAAGLILAGATLTGCKQGEGERCEVNNDCSAGLTCQADNMGGVCTSRPGGVRPADAGTDGAVTSGPDGAASAEAGAGVDLGTAADGASQDVAAPPADVAAAEVSPEAGAAADGATDAAPADAAPVTLDASSN